MGRDPQEPLTAESDEWVFSSGISLGELLRREREKKGLDFTQISQQTRLRPRFLAAIENEAWDQLPAPTLVKGFIRSYARVLNLDEERLLDLYREESGTEDFSQDFVLPSTSERRKWPYVVVPLLVLMAAAVAYYAWLMFSPHVKEPVRSRNASLERAPDTQPAAAPPKEARTASEPVILNEALQEPGPELKAGAGGADHQGSEEPESADEPLPAAAGAATASAEKSEGEAPAAAAVPETENLKLHLKGRVTERTWLRIAIDDLKPKEYVFVPSDTPEWRAEKGFELLIGNAGGITLEFNGKILDNLGKQGQVIRIKLPEDEERIRAKN